MKGRLVSRIEDVAYRPRQSQRGDVAALVKALLCVRGADTHEALNHPQLVVVELTLCLG